VRVQEYVYDVIWAMPGIALKEKSLITVVSLIVSNRAEQLKVHLWGLFHQGCVSNDITNILSYTLKSHYAKTTDDAVKILIESKKAIVI